jgi:hypothetical protein
MNDVILGLDDEANPALEQCIGLLQKPGCGREPVETGDRGGTMQVATFGVLLAALAVIGVRIARAVIARDRTGTGDAQ